MNLYKLKMEKITEPNLLVKILTETLAVPYVVLRYYGHARRSSKLMERL